MEEPTQEIWTLAETAQYLRLSSATVWRLAKDGVLPSFRVNPMKTGKYLFLAEQVKGWVAAKAVEVATNV